MAYRTMYRVEHADSMTYYDDDYGIVTKRGRGRALTLWPPNKHSRQFRYLRADINDQGWRNNTRPTGLISTFEDEWGRAKGFAKKCVDEGERDVVIFTIQVPRERCGPRVQFRSLRPLRDYLGLSSPPFMKGEVVFLNRIPAEYIVDIFPFK